MTMKEIIALALFCLLVAAGSLAVAGWALVAGEGLTLDTLLLVAICVSLSGLFGLVFLWIAYDAKLLDLIKKPGGASANPAPAAGNPSKTENGE